jgi:hypothetical protein
LSPAAANAYGSDSVRRNDQIDGFVEAGTTGVTMDGFNAIDESRFRDGGLQVGVDALCESQ